MTRCSSRFRLGNGVILDLAGVTGLTLSAISVPGCLAGSVVGNAG